MHDDEQIPLPRLAAELRSAYGTAPAYGALYRAALDGTLPARLDRGRWRVARADLPRIAELFDLPVAA